MLQVVPELQALLRSERESPAMVTRLALQRVRGGDECLRAGYGPWERWAFPLVVSALLLLPALRSQRALAPAVTIQLK